MTPMERFYPWNMGQWVLNDAPAIHWLDADHFTYDLETRLSDGCVDTQTLCVSCADGSEQPLGGDFPKAAPQQADICVSPNGQLEAFVKESNVWLHVRGSGETFAATTDGWPEHPYGESPEFNGSVGRNRIGAKRPPAVQWSPDSRQLLICRTDMRQVKQNYVLEYCAEHADGSLRPILHSYQCPFAGEPIPLAGLYLYDIGSRRIQKLDLPLQPSYGNLLNPQASTARWLADGSAFHFTWMARANKEARFYIVSREGMVRQVLTETAENGFLNIDSFGQQDGFGEYRFSNFLTADQSTVFWQSEREDLARLYRYDAETGKCLGAVTPPDSMAGKIMWVDESEHWIYYMGSNFSQASDPYYQKLCRVRFDGSCFQILTPEDGMHTVSIGGGGFVDTWSRVDLPPVTVLRRMDGTQVRELVKADVTALLEAGYVMPQRFTVEAEDGTPLYGILVSPAKQKPKEKYPVVDYIYGGMQCYNVPKVFTWQGKNGREAMGGLQSLAQAGIAGIILDGPGTPSRGRRFHQLSYQNIHGCAGLREHVRILEQLQEIFPFLNLQRVGIWGSSGGGMAAARAILEYPSVYHAAVASAGNHDQRLYDAAWTERYNGLYDKAVYRAGDVTALAANLKGSLLIAHGAMDDNVPVAQSMRLIEALIRADKDFDMLILPTADHGLPGNRYFIRRKNEYLLQHLSEINKEEIE